MKAYKVINPDWTCRGFKYEVGKSYHCDGKIKICSNGFHACEKAAKCFDYYDFNSSNHVCEVELSGEIISDEKGKSCASDILIIKEIAWSELLTVVNEGKNCTGLCNTGDRNTGDWNTGDWNTGDRNTGLWNTGNRNTGDWNTGNRNTGLCNTGDWNTGNWNTGNRNTGDRNTGDRNTGDWNTGLCNTGNRNTGDWNTGLCNTGDCNTGNWNTGNWNTGLCNTGNWNTGNWNTGNRNTGFFNTDEETVRMFNKDTGKKRNDINFPVFLDFDTTQWVSDDTATKEEKEQHKTEIETYGGFLKKLNYKTAFKRAWSNASEEEKEQVKSLPNFDPDIFFEISGIRV
jgi:hypothetical protein